MARHTASAESLTPAAPSRHAKTGRSLGELVKKAVANASSCVLIILGSFTGNNMLQGRGIEVLRAQLAERCVH